VLLSHLPAKILPMLLAPIQSADREHRRLNW